MELGRRIDQLLRDLTPQVLAVLVRRTGDFSSAEDAMQESAICAIRAWEREGIPSNPRAWLITSGLRWWIDEHRRDIARQQRELGVVSQPVTPEDEVASEDDTLALFFMCCHPALTPTAAIPLTLRAVGGLTTSQIAAAFLLPETTIGQRISRAKRTIRNAGIPAQPLMPADNPADNTARLAEVLHVLYLMFNAGYTVPEELGREPLSVTTEAIRLVRQLLALTPWHADTKALLALMLLTEARRSARLGPNGELVPLHDQDRTHWDSGLLSEGLELARGALADGPRTEYQIQTAVSVLHLTAPSVVETDWSQILRLYERLERMTGNPMVGLSKAVAIAMVSGSEYGLEAVHAVEAKLRGHHRVHVVKAYLLEQTGKHAEAAKEYGAAAAVTTSVAERNYCRTKAATLASTAIGEEG